MMESMDPGLKAFHAALIEDPLFAAEGMDIAECRAALRRLEENARSLTTVYIAGSLIRRIFFFFYPIATHALPVPFLKECVRSEETRRLFLVEPTRATAQVLLAQWRTTAVMYGTCARRYRALHRLLFRLEKRKPDEVFEDVFGNTYTFGDVLSAVDSLEENSRVLLADVEHKKNLLEGCAKDISGVAAASVPDVSQLGGSLSADQQQALSAIEENMSVFWDVLEKHGPLRCPFPQLDGTTREHLFFVYILCNRSTKTKGMSVVLADTYHFLPLAQTGAPARYDSVTFAPLIQRAIPYWYQPATNFYTCRDQRYWAQLATAIDLVRRPELSREALINQQSSLFHLILSTAGGEMLRYEWIMNARMRAGTLLSYRAFNYALCLQTNPSLFYMTFNKSIWRLAHEPVFVGSGRSERGSVYLTLPQVRTELSDEMFLTVMRGAQIRQEVWKEEHALWKKNQHTYADARRA